MTKTIGIYPGTFDPVHAGHITFSNAAREICHLEEVVFIPEQSPRGKDNATDIHHRIAMLQEATIASEGLAVASLNTPRFTVRDTLPELQQLFNTSHFTFLIGSDAARTLHHWDDIDQLLPWASFAIGLRGTDTQEEMKAVMQQLEQIQHHSVGYTFIPVPAFSHASSSTIRKGDTTHAHTSTAAYIQENNLYIQK